MFDISKYQTRIASCILAELVYKMLNVPLTPVSSGTPAAAAGSHIVWAHKGAHSLHCSQTLLPAIVGDSHSVSQPHGGTARYPSKTGAGRGSVRGSEFEHGEA